MLKFSSNLNEVTSGLISKMKAIVTPNSEARDQMLRTVAFDAAANIKYRIHTEGKNSDDQPIGEYTNAYMRVREANRRGTSKKVIFSLTRQMENDFGIVGSTKGTQYDLGFKNPDNADKAEWLQNNTRYKNGGFGDVYKPTKTEIEQMRLVAEQFIADLLNK